jgi:predicted metal-dependent hydrolase
MDKVFQFEGLTIELVRKTRRRSLTIKLVPFRPVQVLANSSTSEDVIRQFVRERRPWIEKNLNKFSKVYRPPIKRVITEGHSFPLRGTLKPLRFVITPQQKLFFSETSLELLAHIPHTLWTERKSAEILAKLDRIFLRFYRHVAVRELSLRCTHWSTQMNLFPTKLSFRRAHSRWGSCSSTGKISLNWKLICLPTEVQDYVIVHELCHLVHLNHSQRFWNLVEKYMPERRRIQNELCSYQFTVHFLGEPLGDFRI